MPPEPFPWDRRRHDRPGSEPRLSGGGFGRGGPNRWREQQHAPPPYYQQRQQQQQQQQQRWYSDSRSPRLLPPGNGKQGGRHMYSDDAGQGGLPLGSRYADRNSEDGNHRPFGARGDGGYFRNNRENRGSFARKDWKTHSWERANSPSTFASHRPSNYVDLSEQSQSQALVNEKNNKNGGTTDETTRAGPEYGKGNCMGSVDWKPLKWTRLGSSSSRGNKLVAEVKPKHATLGQSLPDDSCVRSTSLVQYEVTESRKKPRLGWGQGLAKFEKKDNEGPEDCAPNNELVRSVTCTEAMLSQSVLAPEKSPRFSSLSDCASPGTPSSVVCSSSPGIEDKESLKEAHMCPDRTILSCSPTIMSHTHYNAPTFNLENFELASIANVSSLIEELLLFNDSTSAETGYARTTSMNKLLVWKVDMLKALEMTESEIESLETELKSLNECEGPSSSSKCGIEFDPLLIDSCEKMIVKEEPVRPEDVHVFSQDANINSPGSVTSKFVEVRPAIFPSETAVSVEVSRNLDVKNSGYSGTATHADLAGDSNVHYNVDNIHHAIFSDNRDAASRAMDQLNKFSPKDCLFDSSIETISYLQRDPSLVKNFLRRKRSLRFKEKVVTLKYKVFEHFWKEGRLVSVRKLRGKKQKKKFGPRRNGHRKNLSSFCSRVSSSVGGRQTVPADEVIQYVNSLLSESAFKPCRNTLKMPALILDKEVKMSRFISVNGLMEDPCAVEKERSMINSWTSQEKDIFLDKLAAFGKDFPKIASFLDHKTVANCIEFYYKNHKSECFDKTRKNPGCPKERKSQSSTYMVTPMTRRNPELNAASLDILSAVSEIAANIDNGMDIQSKSCKAPMSDDGSGSDEREMEAADVLASICVSLSPEAVGSCITSCVERPTRQALTHEVTQDVDEECSDESCAELNPTDWSDEEKSIFIRAVSVHGKDFSKISERVGTRSMDQCKLFFSKARKCLGLDLIQPGPGSSSDDGDGGDGDIEDGSTVEIGPVITNESECKMDEDLPPPDTYQSDTVGAHNSAQLNGHEKEALVGLSDGEENQREGRLLPGGNSVDNTVVERDANSCEASERSSGISETKPDPQPSRNVFLNHKASSAVGANEISGIRFEKTVDCQQHLPCHSMSDSTESSQILQGQPVNLNSDWHTDFFLAKCDRAREQSNVAEASFPSTEPSTTGDVKLFGTILIPSKQKTNSFLERSNSNNRPLILAPGADRPAYKAENYPIRSFGLWDGNRTQTGMPPVPDSAILLAKYPAAFSNLEQPFTIDTKQRQGASDEMRGRQYSGLSDPVAAIRMQNVGKEDDRWISSRDVGR